MEKRKNLAVVCLTAAFLLGFLVWSLLKPDDAVSQSERRKLAQKPELTAASVLNGTFMTDFESYTLDQFPLRDGFRRLKAAVLLDMLREKDNNGILRTAMPPSWNIRWTSPPSSMPQSASGLSMKRTCPGQMPESMKP